MNPLVGPQGELRGAQPDGGAARPDGAAGSPPAPALTQDDSPRRRVSAGFMLRHPAHALALGLGSGLSPWAPGTVGTLWAWAMFAVLDPWLHGAGWGWWIVGSLLLGTWACTRTAQHLGIADPSAVVWDEVVAFWIVLWLLTPAGWWAQCGAFVLFRFFDAAKPGPVAWADRLFKVRRGATIGWAQGVGILFDDLVAAWCTLLGVALWVTIRNW